MKKKIFVIKYVYINSDNDAPLRSLTRIPVSDESATSARLEDGSQSQGEAGSQVCTGDQWWHVTSHVHTLELYNNNNSR